MSSRVVDVVCGVSTTVLSTVIVAIGSQVWNHEAANKRKANALEGVHATRALLQPEQEPEPPAPDPLPEPIDVTPPTRAEVELIWKQEMDTIGVTDEELAKMYAVGHVESRFNMFAESPVGALGVHQFMPATGDEEFGLVGCEGLPRTDIVCSARAAHNYLLKRLMRWLPSGVKTHEMALVSYNWGIGNAIRVIEQCRSTPGCDPTNWDDMKNRVPREPRNYVSANRRMELSVRRGEQEVAWTK